MSDTGYPDCLTSPALQVPCIRSRANPVSPNSARSTGLPEIKLHNDRPILKGNKP